MGRIDGEHQKGKKNLYKQINCVIKLCNDDFRSYVIYKPPLWSFVKRATYRIRFGWGHWCHSQREVGICMNSQDLYPMPLTLIHINTQIQIHMCKYTHSHMYICGLRQEFCKSRCSFGGPANCIDYKSNRNAYDAPPRRSVI